MRRNFALEVQQQLREIRTRTADARRIPGSLLELHSPMLTFAATALSYNAPMATKVGMSRVSAPVRMEAMWFEKAAAGGDAAKLECAAAAACARCTRMPSAFLPPARAAPPPTGADGRAGRAARRACARDRRQNCARSLGSDALRRSPALQVGVLRVARRA